MADGLPFVKGEIIDNKTYFLSQNLLFWIASLTTSLFLKLVHKVLKRVMQCNESAECWKNLFRFWEKAEVIFNRN